MQSKYFNVWYLLNKRKIMYYHSRELKYVTYGKVEPVWTDSYLNLNYKWLGQHCGYSPQVWLSKCDVGMTGFKRKQDKNNKNDILFGFDIIKGFPVSMEPWEFSLNAFGGGDKESTSINELNNKLKKHIEESWKSFYSDDPEKDCSEPYMESYDKFLEHLMVEEDQVVLPSLNLKSAKKIICRNEKQKKALMKMGFIEDRIKIKNIKRWNW